MTGRAPNAHVATDVDSGFNEFMADRIASLG